MRVDVHVPRDRAAEYLRLVAKQIDDGCTSGYVDRDTFWDIDEPH